MKRTSSSIVPHGTLFLFLMMAGAPLFASDNMIPSSTASALIAMASDHPTAKQHVELGMRDQLMGWDEMARQHYRQAVAADADCALAWCGLMLLDGATAEHRDALERIFAEDLPATPQESALLSSWLRLVQAGPGGAGEEFAERAEQYRADTLSACWAIRLLHDGYEQMGACKPLPRQQRALDIAEQLYAHRPQDALVAYLRGWVEESSPQPSETALAAAQYAAESMPEHPAAQLLYGHLLFRMGHVDEALTALDKAAKLGEMARKIVPHGTSEQAVSQASSLEMWPLELRAKLYQSTLLWQLGEVGPSLHMQAELLKQASSIKQGEAPGAILLHWEARTLLLRLLMLSPKLPNDAQVAAASKSALPPGADKNDPLLHVRDCLRFCLVARQRAAGKKRAQAIRCVQSAEASLAQLIEARSLCEGQGGYVLSAWNRACEACQLAIYAAKAAAYPDTASIWLQNLEQGQKTTSLLMPPVLPKSHTNDRCK